MKLSTLGEKTRSILPLLCCPLCGQSFHLWETQSLVCSQNHCYDLSRKGYTNLAPAQNQQASQYHASLFECRQSLFSQGFYTLFMEAICEVVKSYDSSQGAFSLLDAGCGEGSYARYIAERFPQATIMGLDLSRDAIQAACKQSSPVHWLVGNLSQLPIRSKSLTFLLDVLTPADYAEFSRVLQADGLLVKAFPGKDYLVQVRDSISENLRSGSYDDTRVFAHLQKHAAVVEQKTIYYTLPVTQTQAALFARMTPMTSHVPQVRLQHLAFSEITIHLELMVCRMLPSK